MSILNPVSILLIIEDPADNLANANVVIDIPLDSNGCRPTTADILSAPLHLLKTLLPQNHILGSQINPALLRPCIHILFSNPHTRFDPLWNAYARATHNLLAIR